MSRLAIVILAGGRASRMGGGDKPLLTLGGVTMLARVLDALAPDAASVAISANGDKARFADFGLPVLADEPRFAGQGPLAGLLAGLEWAAAEEASVLLTAPGDAPFLPRGLARLLAPAPGFAACDGRDQPLAALWPVACRASLRDWLEGGTDRSVARFASSIGATRRAFPLDRRDWFFNVNTAEDLAMAWVMLANATS